MILADYEIEQAVRTGWVGLDPYDPQLLQPNSLDVRLDRHFLLPGGYGHIDTANVPAGHMQPWEADSVLLRPGDFLLASTFEALRVPRDLVVQLEGKSSLARLGLVIHTTAGWIDSGFEGQVTLEIVNHAPWSLTLHAGATVGQLVFARTAPVRTPYNGRYQRQRGPVESRYNGARTSP